MGGLMSCHALETLEAELKEDAQAQKSSSYTERFQCVCCHDSTIIPDNDNDSNNRENIGAPNLTTNIMEKSHNEAAQNANGALGTKNPHLLSFFPIHKNNFDLNLSHPSSPPFLGTSYWKPVHDSDNDSQNRQEEEEEARKNDTNEEYPRPSTPTKQENIPDSSFLTDYTASTPPPNQANIVSPIFDNTRYNEEDENRIEQILSMQHTPIHILENMRTISTPRRIRSLENSSVSTFATATTTSTSSSEKHARSTEQQQQQQQQEEEGEEQRACQTQTARRLFGDREELLIRQEYTTDDEEDDGDGDDGDCNILNATSTLSSERSPNTKSNFLGATGCGTTTAADDQHSIPYCPPPTYNTSPKSDASSIIIRNGVLIKGNIPSPSSVHSIRHDDNNNNTPFRYRNCNGINYDKYPTHGLSSTMHIPDGAIRHGTTHINTLPSFRTGNPIRLRVTESYAGYSSGNLQEMEDGDGAAGLNMSGISLLSSEEQQDFFSYDPYFSSGEYLIETRNGRQYGNGLRVTMGEQYMTLQDADGRVWAVTRSRHTFWPSTIIYSEKERFPGQPPSSHRPITDPLKADSNTIGDVDLYPWALMKKEGRRMDHDVDIHMVIDPNTPSATGGGGGKRFLEGLFDPIPSFRARHGFDGHNGHSHTVVHRVAEEMDTKWRQNEDNRHMEIPCCIVLHDPINRDVVDVTIAPGIDPLLIICYLAVHAKMDVEPKLCDR